MARWTVPGVFAGLAVLASLHALHAVEQAIASPASRADLIALYFVLRAAVTITFAVVTIRRPLPHRPARDPAAFAACAVAMLIVIPVGGPGSGTATGMVL